MKNSKMIKDDIMAVICEVELLAIDQSKSGGVFDKLLYFIEEKNLRREKISNLIEEFANEKIKELGK